MAIDFAARRFERLEKAQRETNERLEKVEETLGRVADILEVHSRHFERIEDALLGISARVDRLTTVLTRARTQDLGRIQDIDKRLRALERRSRRTRL
jgi:hypothetical protein